MNIASSVEKIKSHPDHQFDPAINEIVIWASGYKISKKVLGRSSNVTIIFQKRLLRSGLAKESPAKSPPKLKQRQWSTQPRENASLSRISNPNNHQDETKSSFPTKKWRKDFRVRNSSSTLNLRESNVMNLLFPPFNEISYFFTDVSVI